MKLKLYIAVGIGGVIGTILRYIISSLFTTEPFATFPWATFIVNMTGAFLLTWVVFQPFFVRRLDPNIFVALTTGLLGSYTTFSTLILEATVLLNNNLTIALLYIVLTIIGGLFASFLGYIVTVKTSGNEGV